MKKYIFDLELYRKDCLDHGRIPILSWSTECHGKEVIYNSTDGPFATGICCTDNIVPYFIKIDWCRIEDDTETKSQYT